MPAEGSRWRHAGLIDPPRFAAKPLDSRTHIQQRSSGAPSRRYGLHPRLICGEKAVLSAFHLRQESNSMSDTRPEPLRPQPAATFVVYDRRTGAIVHLHSVSAAPGAEIPDDDQLARFILDHAVHA